MEFHKFHFKEVLCAFNQCFFADLESLLGAARPQELYTRHNKKDQC